MEFSGQAISTLRNLREKPGDPALQRSAGMLYWNIIEENVFGLARQKKDPSGFLAQEHDLLDFGISPALREDARDVCARMNGVAESGTRHKIILVTDWIAEVYRKTISGDRLESLDRELKIAERQFSRYEQEIANGRQLRREILSKESGNAAAAADLMDRADELYRYILKIKRMSSKGVFIPVEEKRKNCKLQQDYEKLRDQAARLTGSIRLPDAASAVKQCAELMEENITGALDSEEAIARIREDLANVQKRQHDLSAAEIEATIRKELDYVKEMMRLSAKRIHRECCCFLKPGDICCTVSEVDECVERVIEFDPEIVHNQRVSLFGLPGILLIPGTGSSLYDWKNNRILVPLSAPDGNLMASIASGFIEYRLDVDEEKRLLTSYSKLPRHKDVRSVLRLKSELIKDYIVWMTSEYKGFKIFAREERKWFEQEIAPPRNDIAVPLPYRTYMMSGEEFNEKCREMESVLSRGPEAAHPETLWMAGILLYQQGKFSRSAEALQELVKKRPDHLTAWYNLGHVFMKLMRKQEAMQCFGEYCKRNPQSWWSSVAMEHVRRLQAGHVS